MKCCRMLAVVIVKTNENLRRCMKEEFKYRGKWRIYYVFVGSAAKLQSHDLEVR
jgi:hypothetical protein